MLNDWSDNMDDAQAAAHWRRLRLFMQEERLERVERELDADIKADALAGDSFFEAMRHFLILREKLFPSFPADPAWKILVTLAETPEDSAKSNISGIIYGAGVPFTTALRYIAAMEDQGIIERVPHPSDQRQAMIRLTAEGRARLKAIADGWKGRILWGVIFPAAVLLIAGAAYALSR